MYVMDVRKIRGDDTPDPAASRPEEKEEEEEEEDGGK